MMGKTHYRLGIIYYILLSIIPVLFFMPFVDKRITIAGIAVAAFGGLMPDADSQHSKINQMNPLTAMTGKAVDVIGEFLENAARIALLVGIGVIMFVYSDAIMVQVMKIKELRPYANLIVYGVAGALIFLGLTGGQTIRAIPVLRDIYKEISVGVEAASNLIKRCFLVLIYSGSGILLVIYNFKYGKHDFMLYLIAVLFIGIGVFPHRTFLHSIEGFILSTLAFGYAVKLIGYPNLIWPFFVGYGSHLYLADLLTREGIPLSIIPRILRTLHLDRMPVISLICRILDIRLRLPIMRTGSDFGSVFEATYVIGMLLLTASIYFSKGVHIAFI